MEEQSLGEITKFIKSYKKQEVGESYELLHKIEELQRDKALIQ